MTNENKITITKGLSDLKMLDKRIRRKIHGSVFGGYAIGDKVQTGYKTQDELEKSIRSNFDSVRDLIEQRNKLKSAIVKSNAETKVEIGGIIYTVAEAIERKNSIEYDMEFLSVLKSAYTGLRSKVISHNNEMDNRLDKHLETLFGKDGKNNATETEGAIKVFKELNEAKLIDPINLKEQIETLEQQIEDFMSEVDHVLSVSNATTMIDF